jgi:tetratricopeptide (TPR) repeat protein
LRARKRVSSVRPLTLSLCVSLASWIATPPCARGQDKVEPAQAAEDRDEPGEPPAEALKHYERGRALYKAGRYREALAELQMALFLDPNSPNLVYNVARVHELLGEIDLAIEHYVRYQKLLPPDQADEIARVESTSRRIAPRNPAGPHAGSGALPTRRSGP